MTDPKHKQSPSLREPKPKKKLGLNVPQPLRLPHEDLVKPLNTFDETNITSMTSHTGSQPIAPTRDFTKVANSITREVIPAGIFKGKSKQLYDYLYSVTRGAIVPSRTVRLSRPKLMKATGIGSRVTFDANITRLCQAGLISVRSIVGEHNGNEYTVFLPEEIELSMPSLTSLTGLTGYAQKLDRLVRLETSQTRHTSNVEESTTSALPKTSLKTIHDDDDGISEFWRVLSAAAEQVLGRDLPKSEVERERWRECAEVLAEELKRAAKRAGNVSSVPAFFAAHLRRRFKTGQGSKSEKPDPELTRKQASALSTEQRLMKTIKELRMLHIGEFDYQETDLIDDLKFRCERAGIAWDEEMVQRLLNSSSIESGGNEQ